MNIPSGTFPDSPKVTQNIKSQPVIAPTAFIATGAIVVGNVTLGEEASVWFNTTLRGDINSIQVGAHSNVQDGAVVHVADLHEAIIGQWVTVGHNAIVHACTVEDEVLIGMGAIILDGARIGARSIVGAGALVTGNTVIPPGSLVLGSPAKVARALTESEQNAIKSWAERYVALSRIYQAEAEVE